MAVTPTSVLMLMIVLLVSTIISAKIGDGNEPQGIPPADLPTPKITLSPRTGSPSKKPTGSPTTSPSSINPTISPTKHPTHEPTTWKPTINGETRSPTKPPIISPTRNPSITPTKVPSISPTTTKPTSTPNIERIQNGPIFAANNNDKNGNGINDTLEFMSAPAIPIQAICFIIILTLLIAMIYNLYIKTDSKHNQIVRSIKIPVLLTFFSNILGVICLIIITVMIATATTWDRDTYNIALIPYYGLAITYSFGKFCLETFFIFRAYNAFKNSAYQISMVTVGILCLWMVLMSIAWCYMFMIDTFQLSYHGYYGYLIVTGFEILFVVILLYIFTKRLTKLLLQQKSEQNIELSSTKSIPTSSMPSSSPNVSSLQSVQSIPSMSPRSSTNAEDVEIVNYDGIDSDDNGYNQSKSRMSKFLALKRANQSQEFSTSDIKSVQNKLTSQQTKLIFLITRCIILSGIALVTTTIFSIVLFYFEVFGMHIFIVYALWTIDMATNCICLYLNFIFSTNIYKKCCKLCHNSCQNMFEYCAARKILKDHLDEMEQQQSL